MKDQQVNTTDKVKDDGVERMPHERDESPEAERRPRDIMKQAASDIDRGLVDTDLRNKPGVEKVKPSAPHPDGAQPQPHTKRD